MTTLVSSNNEAISATLKEHKLKRFPTPAWFGRYEYASWRKSFGPFDNAYDALKVAEFGLREKLEVLAKTG